MLSFLSGPLWQTRQLKVGGTPRSHLQGYLVKLAAGDNACAILHGAQPELCTVLFLPCMCSYGTPLWCACHVISPHQPPLFLDDPCDRLQVVKVTVHMLLLLPLFCSLPPQANSRSHHWANPDCIRHAMGHSYTTWHRDPQALPFLKVCPLDAPVLRA